MIETFCDIETADGSMNTFITKPDGDGPYPVVLFLMDAPGMREELRDMSRRIATTGYYVIAPNLYYRDVAEFNVFDTGDRDRMFELMGHLTSALVIEDARSMLAYADADPAADASRVGTVGYCMSGPFALMVAVGHNERVRAAASIHGVSLAVDAEDSPHRHLGSINGEIYVGCAENDHYAPPEMVSTFEAAMAANATVGQVEWYPGTEHGFAFRERPAYVKDASERHWERLHGIFDRNLR